MHLDLVLCVHNTFLSVKDVNEQARKMTRSQSDSSLFSSMRPYKVQSDDEQYPMGEVGEGHWAATAQVLSSGWGSCILGGDSSCNEGYARVFIKRC